jgi:hypothetical protein
MVPKTVSPKNLFAALLLVVPVLPAQNPDPPPAQSPVISIDFAGGTLRELLDAIRRVEPRLNITASALAQEVTMPDLSIKGATVLSVLNAAAAIAPQEYAVACQDTGGPGAPVYMVKVEQRQMVTPGGAVARREVRVFSLRAVIEPQPGDSKDRPIALPVETVLSALDAGVRLGTQEQAELKYHRETGLLFVNGSPAQITVVNEVLRNLNSDHQMMRIQAASRGTEPGKEAK